MLNMTNFYNSEVSVIVNQKKLFQLKTFIDKDQQKLVGQAA